MKKNIYNICRDCLKNLIVGNLGKVIEEEDRLVCYVKKEKLKKEDLNYRIYCNGIKEKYQSLATKHNLNKPICYIFDGLEFKDCGVYIFGRNNSEVIIKNCQFGHELEVYVNGKCTLENSFMKSIPELSIIAGDLILKNMDIKNNRYMQCDLDIWIMANNKLNIIDSYIGRKNEYTNLLLFAYREINLENVKVAGKNIEVKARKFESNNTYICAENQVELKIEEFETLDITSPTIIYNEEEYSFEKQHVYFKKIVEPLTAKRLDLIKYLKNIKDQCARAIDNELEQHENVLKQQSVCKTLKR